MIAAAWMLSMWLGVGMSGPQHDAAESSVSATLLRIDVNAADERELSLLPGVGPVLAQRIVSNRERQGQFGSVDDLQRVHGVGPKTIERLGEVCEANR
jgi:competence protein ComEA